MEVASRRMTALLSVQTYMVISSLPLLAVMWDLASLLLFLLQVICLSSNYLLMLALKRWQPALARNLQRLVTLLCLGLTLMYGLWNLHQGSSPEVQMARAHRVQFALCVLLALLLLYALIVIAELHMLPMQLCLRQPSPVRIYEAEQEQEPSSMFTLGSEDDDIEEVVRPGGGGEEDLRECIKS